MAKKIPSFQELGFEEDKHGGLSIGDIKISPPPIATLSLDVPEKRLIITHIHLRNFKSYGNDLTIGPLDKNFSAVVGANGSGKSNVLDSLLFVFGYRSSKLRSKKMSQLIHKSDKLRDVQSCTVTIHFAMIKEQDESYEIIPKTEFTVSRTVTKDDTSTYELSGRRISHQKLALELRNYGIDLEHARFLILQGEIEQISLLPPKGQNENDFGMLEYIEEIIGTARYIEPIKKLKKNLEELEAIKQEKFNVLKLIEKERDDLEEPKNKAVEYLRLENRLILNENSILRYKSYAAEKELVEISQSKKEFVEKLNKIKAEMNELKNSKKSQEADFEKICSELEIHKKDLEKYKEGYKKLERQDVELHEEIKHLKTKKSKIESSLQSTNNELEKMKKMSEVHAKETTELTEMKKKLEADKTKEEAKLSEVMDSVQTETTILQEKKDLFEAELLSIKKKVYNMKSEMELVQSELDIYTRSEKKEREALANLISSYENAQKSCIEEEKLLNKEKEKIGNLQSEADAIEKQMSEAQIKLPDVAKQVTSLQLKYEEANKSVSTFSRSVVLQGLAREKANGRLTGVYGRLGDLGAIDKKYDVAISTACTHLESIVVDTVDTAQQCIKLMKEKNLGYANFIPLEKMSHWIPQSQKKIATPENIPRLFDLVSVKNPDVLPAFYFALRDTLVADDIEQATRIGYQGSKRHRVVTLNGNLIELTGTMSGGGSKKVCGRMGQEVIECSYTPEEISRMKQELQILWKEHNDIKKLISNLTEQCVDKTKEVSKVRLSVRKREMNYKTYVDNVETLKSQIEGQKQKVEDLTCNEKKIAELKENIALKQKGYQAASKEASAVEDKVSKLQEEILKITKGSYSKVKKNLDQITKKIAEVSQSITKSAVSTKTCSRNIKKAEDKIKNLEKELETITQTKTKLDAEREKCVEKARDFLAKQEKTQTIVSEFEEKKVALKKALETFSDKELQLKLEEGKHKNEIKEKDALESEKRSYLKGYTAKLAKLKLNVVEDDPTEIPNLTAEEIEALSIKRISADSELIKVQLEEIKPDMSSIAEYKKKDQICKEKQKDLDEVTQKRNIENWRQEALSKRRLTEFMKGFVEIAKKLKEVYQMLTLGGDAELELVETMDPFKGIEFNVRPPRKSWKFIRNLSGGEKTLSSLALVFALQYYRHTPFYVMDEIDAALDARNVAIVGYYIKECTKNTQFILVSLRDVLNELANLLVGIYKTENCSKNVTLRGADKWKAEDEAEDAAKELAAANSHLSS